MSNPTPRLQKFIPIILLSTVWIISATHSMYLSLWKFQLGVSGASVALLYTEAAILAKPRFSLERWDTSFNPPLTTEQQKQFPLLRRLAAPIHSRLFIHQSSGSGDFYAIFVPVWFLIICYVISLWVIRRSKTDSNLND